MKPRLAQIVCILSLLALPAIAAAPPSGGHTISARRAALPAESPDRARVIVQYRADSALMREAALAASGAREPRVQHAARMAQRLGLPLEDGNPVMPRTQVLHARGLSSSQLVARLRADPDVEAAWVDERVRIAAAPNDPRYAGNQTSITPAVGQWYLRAPDTTIVSAINAEGAWDVTTGSPAIVVAVLDTGVRPDHPDLAGKLLPGYDFVSEDAPGVFATANDNNGRDADPSDPGDWVTQNESDLVGGPFEGCGASPSSWHGTQTAGLVGAATNNNAGMASVGRDARVLPVRVLGKCGGFLSDVVAGMRWAAGLTNIPVANPNRAQVVNLSLGSTDACAGSLYEAAVNELVAAGVVVVAAAGNDAGHAVGKPANCAGVIGVGGLRHVGTKVGFSDVGPEISISAPGGNCVNLSGECVFPLLTTTNSGSTTPAGNTYSDGFNASVGTSFSSPLTAGTVALMLSRNPTLTPSQIKTGLMRTARAFPTSGAGPGTAMCAPPSDTDQLECYCTTTTCGAGMLSASAAVLASASLRAWIAPAASQVQVGSTVTINGADSWAAFPNTLGPKVWTIQSGAEFATLSPAGNTAILAGIAPGTVVVRLSVTDNAGTPASVADTTITVLPPPVNNGGGGGGALSFAWLIALAVAAMRLKHRERGTAVT